MNMIPTILFVDDNIDEVRVFEQLIGNEANVTIVHPNEVDAERLTRSDLVLIDYKIDYWPAREDVQQVGLRPLTGVALAAVLRDYVMNPQTDGSPVAFGILSGRVQELSRGLPVEHRTQVLAATNNLEWIFSKAQTEVVAKQAVSLASAVASLPEDWAAEQSTEAARGQLIELLDLNESNWYVRGVEDVERCHPPLHELSKWSHGMAIVRWLLHVILPYPCFLMDSLELAQRLRVTPSSLDKALAHPAFRDAFLPAEYTGMLSQFDGARWWRSGVESLLWEGTKGRSFDTTTIRSFLSTLFDAVEVVEIDDPVICLDENNARDPRVIPRSKAVRIQPDQWPAFAEPAWTSIELAREVPGLKALVIEQDRTAVGEEG